MNDYRVQAKVNGEVITLATGLSEGGARIFALRMPGAGFTDVEYCGDGLCTCIPNTPSAPRTTKKLHLGLRSTEDLQRAADSGTLTGWVEIEYRNEIMQRTSENARRQERVAPIINGLRGLSEDDAHYVYHQLRDDRGYSPFGELLRED